MRTPALNLLLSLSMAFSMTLPAFAQEGDAAASTEKATEAAAPKKAAKPKREKKQKVKVAEAKTAETTASDTASTEAKPEASVDGEKTAKAEKPKREKRSLLKLAQKDPKGGDAKADPKPKSSSSSKGGSDVGLPTRMASFTTGLVVGIPINIVRRSAMEIVQGTRDLVGETDNWLILAPAGVIAIPYGCVSGGVGGVLYGIKNSWVGSGDEPFGSESFSLGDM